MLCTIDESNRLFKIYKDKYIAVNELNNQLREKSNLMKQYAEGSDFKKTLEVEVNNLSKEIPKLNFELQLAAIDLDNFKTNVKIEVGIGLNDEDSNKD